MSLSFRKPIIAVPVSVRERLGSGNRRLLKYYTSKFKNILKQACQAFTAPAVIVGRACVVPASSRGPRVVLLGHLVKALLSLVKCFLFASIVSSVHIIAVVAAVGTYPHLVLRDRQPITDHRKVFLVC